MNKSSDVDKNVVKKNVNKFIRISFFSFFLLTIFYIFKIENIFRNIFGDDVAFEISSFFILGGIFFFFFIVFIWANNKDYIGHYKEKFDPLNLEKNNLLDDISNLKNIANLKNDEDFKDALIIYFENILGCASVFDLRKCPINIKRGKELVQRKISEKEESIKALKFPKRTIVIKLIEKFFG